MLKITFNKTKLLQNPEDYSSKLPLKLLEQYIIKCTKAYEEGIPIISDTIFDTIYDVLKKRDPENKLLKDIGFKGTLDKTELPYHMGSMNKIKEIDKIIKWIDKNKNGDGYIISSKLDGVSALLSIKDGKYKLYTRGDGTYGRDISYLVGSIGNIPKKVNKNMYIRGELIVSKVNFNNYGDKYSNSRSMVSSIITTLNVHEDIKYLDFIVFEMIEMEGIEYNLENQFELCKNNGFTVVDFELIKLAEKNIDFYLDKLLKFRLNSGYDIDGIIISTNGFYEKNISGNPEYAFAFKSNGFGVISKVKNVEWNISKHGTLIPRIEIEEIHISGVKIKFCTGFNAKFINDNKIGIGSELRIVRSGDVIPFIIEVITFTKPLMPKIDYLWNDSKVNIYVEEDTDDQLSKKLQHFFKTLKISNISIGLINKLISNGYNSIKKIITISKNELINIEGIQTVLCNKLYTNIHNIIDNPIDLELIMTASLEFGHGFGLKKIKSITDSYPNILEIQNVTSEMIQQIDGFSVITSDKFVKNLDNFKNFLKDLEIIKIKKKPIKKKLKIVGGLFHNKKVVLTGFRNENISLFIEKHNGVLSNSVNKNTNLLIIKDKESRSTKVKLAEMLGIPIITKDKFIEKFNLT